MTAGTGGTITGVREGDQARGARLQDRRRRSRGLDPRGSGEIKTYKVEGIGYDFIPTCSIGGSSIGGSNSNDRDSFLVARQ